MSTEDCTVRDLSLYCQRDNILGVFHCDHWYEDEGCHACGTQTLNLLIIEGEDE